MLRIWRQIRSHWNRSDTFVAVGNTVAFALFIGNCWWESVDVAYLAALGPLAIQAILARRDPTLRHAWVFGAMAGFLWPFGEWFVVTVFGWWGEYLAPGPRILETPFYCIFIGWLSSTYCAYIAQRALQMGFSLRTAVVNTGMAALMLGIIGENLFVAGRMWVYEPSLLDWWYVPAFVPVSYGLGYATLPLLRNRRAIPQVLLFTSILLVFSVGLGLATGFFPR